MKKVLAVAVVLLGLGTAAHAQGFSIFAGGQFAMGSYAKGEKADFALFNQESSNGGATGGFNLGVQYDIPFFLNGLNAFVSADFFYDALKSDFKEGYKDFADYANPSDMSIPAYLNVPVMVGFNYDLINLAGTSLWLEAGLGVNFRWLTNNKLSYDATIGALTGNATAKNVYNMAASFAWKAGLGVTLNEHYTICLHYYGFGSGDVKGTAKTEVSSNVSGTQKTENEFKAGKVNPGSLVIRLGYTF